MLIKLKIKTQGSGSGGSGAKSQALAGLQQLATLQSKINQEMEKLMARQKSGGLSKADQKKLDELSKRQDQIGKEIGKMMGGEGDLHQGLDRILGSLSEIQREIEEIKARMKRKKLNPQLLKRQKDLHKRLSNAAKHLKEDSEEDSASDDDDEKSKRKAERPTLLMRERKLLDAKKRLRSLLKKQKIHQPGKLKKLTPRQRKKVKDYFKSLEEFSKKE